VRLRKRTRFFLHRLAFAKERHLRLLESEARLQELRGDLAGLAREQELLPSRRLHGDIAGLTLAAEATRPDRHTALTCGLADRDRIARARLVPVADEENARRLATADEFGFEQAVYGGRDVRLPPERLGHFPELSRARGRELLVVPVEPQIVSVSQRVDAGRIEPDLACGLKPRPALHVRCAEAA